MRREVFAGVERVLRQGSRAAVVDHSAAVMTVCRTPKPLVVRRVAGDRG
ncbi:hypothetical protein [Nocardia wallacei]|nr:hypothetical protein [Nocardia wallacei]